jgi:CheY-like chemotaxis protein
LDRKLTDRKLTDRKLTLRRSNVLVVDDKRANILTLEVVLADEHNVLSASSGEEAIALLQSHPPVDVILMDVQMPGMDGFEAASLIKKIEGYEDVPIIFVTAVFTEDPFIKQGFQAGGIDYFTKPFDPEILKMKVAVYASFRQRADLLKAREGQIRESEELLKVGRKLSAVLESLPVGVLIADVEGRICQMTDQVARILKCESPAERDAYGEILGWWDSNGRAIKDGRGPLSRALRSGEVSHSERVAILCCDGSDKTVFASASPLRSLDGRIVGAVVLIQDVSETEKIEEDLEKRVARLVGAGVELEETAGAAR